MSERKFLVIRLDGKSRVLDTVQVQSHDRYGAVYAAYDSKAELASVELWDVANAKGTTPYECVNTSGFVVGRCLVVSL